MSADVPALSTQAQAEVTAIVADAEMLIAGAGTEEERVEAVGRLLGMVVEGGPHREAAVTMAAQALGMVAP